MRAKSGIQITKVAILHLMTILSTILATPIEFSGADRSKFIIDRGKKCLIQNYKNTQKNQKRIICEDINTRNTFDYSLEEYINQFGVPFQLTGWSRRVSMSGLIWKQKGSFWTLRSTRRHLRLSDLDFHALYSKNPYFEHKVALGGFAACKALNYGRSFNCEFPWGEGREINRRRFLSLFLSKRIQKREMCLNFGLESFWNLDGRLWRCWNGYFWPAFRNQMVFYELNYYQFQNIFGGVDFILEEQPDPIVNLCDYRARHSRLVEVPVWECRFWEMEKDQARHLLLDSIPYLQRNLIRIPKSRLKDFDKIDLKVSQLPQQLLSATKKVRILALLTPKGETRYLTQKQFSNIFFVEKTAGEDFFLKLSKKKRGIFGRSGSSDFMASRRMSRFAQRWGIGHLFGFGSKKKKEDVEDKPVYIPPPPAAYSYTKEEEESKPKEKDRPKSSPPQPPAPKRQKPQPIAKKKENEINSPKKKENQIKTVQKSKKGVAKVKRQQTSQIKVRKAGKHCFKHLS